MGRGVPLEEVFSKRCKADFGFDPVADGALVAAELLAKGRGKWEAVSGSTGTHMPASPMFMSGSSRFSRLSWGCSMTLANWQGTPGKRGEDIAALRLGCPACWMQRRHVPSINKAEQEHGGRRDWLWRRMGRSPLVVALGHLSRLVELSATLPSGSTPEQLAVGYQGHGWQVDAAALDALAADRQADVEAVSAVLRSMYLPWLDERLQEAAKSVGLPPR